MGFMTDEVRDLMNEYLGISNTTQQELADAAGKHAMQVNKALRGREGNITSTWEAMLEATGLKIVLVPKDTDVRAKKLIENKALKVRGTDDRVKPVKRDGKKKKQKLSTPE